MRDPNWIFLRIESWPKHILTYHKDEHTNIIREVKTLMTGRSHNIPVESTRRYHHPDNETISLSFYEAYRSAVRKGLINER